MNARDGAVPMSDCAQLELLLVQKGLTAPRVTLGQVESVIKSTDYLHFQPSQLTICVLTLVNGFTVTGESACASPENFNQEVGEQIALRNAKDKIWLLEGYALKQRLYEASQAEV